MEREHAATALAQELLGMGKDSALKPKQRSSKGSKSSSTISNEDGQEIVSPQTKRILRNLGHQSDMDFDK